MAAADTGSLPKVRGRCPFGHGETLYLLESGTIACSDSACRRPYAVTEIISDTETEHLVVLEGKGYWTSRHPLRERLGNDLTRCDLGDFMGTFNADPLTPGVYRATRTHGIWTLGLPISEPPGEPAEVTATVDEPLIDPDCRDGKCLSCVGPPCEHECHQHPETSEVPAP